MLARNPAAASETSGIIHAAYGFILRLTILYDVNAENNGKNTYKSKMYITFKGLRRKIGNAAIKQTAACNITGRKYFFILYSPPITLFILYH